MSQLNFKKINFINKLGGRCKNCNDKNILHLVFHHLSDKKDRVSIILNNHVNNTNGEVEKCELLCNNCHREYHYKNDVKYKHRRNSKNLFLNLSNIKCAKCNYSKCEAALTFHHLNKSGKKFSIANHTKCFKSISEITDDILSEIGKCVVLCANCHSEEHVRHDIVKYVLENYDNISIRNKSSKLDRNLIADMYINKKMKQIEIAKELNVSKGTISDIIKELNYDSQN